MNGKIIELRRWEFQKENATKALYPSLRQAHARILSQLMEIIPSATGSLANGRAHRNHVPRRSPTP
jgi:hypothetical protein